MNNSVLSSLKVNPYNKEKYPEISYGKGVYLFDTNNEKYLDAVSGTAAVSNIGHGNKELGEIVKNRIAELGNYPTFRFSSGILERYFHKVLDFCPQGFSKMWTVSSGTEAVENAIKLSIQYFSLIGLKSKYKIITRKTCYHGNSLFTLSIGGVGPRKMVYSNLLKEKYDMSNPYVYRSEKDGKTYLQECIVEFEEIVKAESPDTVAAVVVEPISGASLGAVFADEFYYQGIKKICEKYNVLFIADEVMTGFGRTGENFGINHFNVIPDIIAVGKGMSGGYYPLSGIIIHENIAEVFVQKKQEFIATHTFACNQLGAVIGEFVLDFIIENKLVSNSKQMGDYLFAKLIELKKYPIVGDIRGKGLMIGIEFVKNKQTKEPFDRSLNLTGLVAKSAFDKGLIVYEGSGSYDGIKGDHILLTPPLIINKEEVDVLCKILDETLKEVSSYVLN